MPTTALEIAAARLALPRPELRRAIRQNAQLSLAELAEELDTDPATVRRWERGDRRPSRRYVIAYVSLLRELARISEQGVA